MPTERQKFLFSALAAVATVAGAVIALLTYLDSRPSPPSATDPDTAQSTAAAPSRTVEGVWKATDVGDRSQMTLRITKTGSVYNVALDDALASAFCKTTGATVTSKGTLSGNRLSTYDGLLICYDGRRLDASLTGALTFQPDTDTLTEDGTNILYTRAE